MEVTDYATLPWDRAIEESKIDEEVQEEVARGNLDKAEQLCRTLIRQHGAPNVLEKESLAKAHHALGLVMLRQQKYGEAQDEFGLAYGRYKRWNMYGSEDAVLVRFHSGLLSFHQSYFSRAREIFRDLAQQKTVETDIACEKKYMAGFMIGRILHEEERYGEAEAAIRKSIQALESTLRKDHPQIPGMLFFLGPALHQQNKFEDAVSLYHKHIDMLKEQEGRDHPDIPKIFYNWGLALLNQNLHREAQLLFRDAAVIRERQEGGDSLELLNYKSHSGRASFYLRQFDQAEHWLRPTIAGFERMGEPGRGELLINKFWLACVLLYRNERRESEDLLQESLPGMINMLGDQHAHTQMARRYLESIHGQAQQPVVIATDIQDEKQKSLNPQTPETLPYLEDVPAQVPKLPVILSDTPNAADESLDRFFSDDHNRLVPYTEAQIDDVSRILKHSKSLSWAQVPRTYIILRIIGQLGKLDDLLKDGFSDYHFPVDELKLPNVLSPSMKQSFVEHQNLVLTASIGVEHGQHRQYEQDKDVPFERICVLGKGGYGQVDRVRSKVSYKEYARKKVYRGRAFRGASREMVEMFISEIQILQRLKHQHIVELIGSYTDDKYINLLMSPVASMDLAQYLRLPHVNRPELRTFYGCLAVALEYLHTQKIRHKDLKPQNILIEGGTVLLTDFGLALDFKDSTGSTTVGMVGPCTRKYAAPEVISGDPRDSSSDIWSLGAVYMEMTVVLKGLGMQRLKDLYDVHDSWQYMAQRQSDDFQSFFVEAESTGDSRDNVPLEWCGQMLSVEQNSRPSASALVEKIMKASMEGEMGFCGICCEAEEHEV